MLQDQLLIILALLFVTSMLALVSERFRISYPILLVLVGLAISFLPPLLYAAAWTISWASFWRLRRPIEVAFFNSTNSTASFPCVVTKSGKVYHTGISGAQK